jgi:integrase
MTKRREPRQHRRHQAWTVDDARWFLESTWHAREALYAALVLVLVLGLRTGEVLGLAWDQVDLDEAELYVGEQFQQVRGKLVRREVKTETSEAPLRLPICATAQAQASQARRLARMTVAAVCCCRKIKNGQPHDRDWSVNWVGDTGIEPVTSSV